MFLTRFLIITSTNLYSIYSHGDLNKEIKYCEDHTKIYTKKYKDSLNCLSTSTTFSNIYNIVIFSVLNGTASYLYLNKKIKLNTLIAIIITVIYYTPSIDILGAIIPDIMHYYGSLKAIDNFSESYSIKLYFFKNSIIKFLLFLNLWSCSISKHISLMFLDPSILLKFFNIVISLPSVSILT